VLVKNESNQGIVKSLNRGVALAKGEYVARMDADDICMLDRLEKQYEFMKKNPEIGLCGCGIREFGAIERKSIYPQSENEIKAFLLFNSAFAHPAVMVRRELLHTLKYRDDYRGAEDYELWTRCVHCTKSTNLPDILLKYRRHKEQVSIKEKQSQQETADRVRLSYLQSIHSDFTSEDAMILGKMARREFIPYPDVDRLLRKVLQLRGKFLNEVSVKRAFAQQYWWSLGENCDKGTKCIKEFMNYYKKDVNRNFATNKMKFFLKCLLKWRSG
jgi:glycosyltransferase involved in cell wall biosynthesis